MADNNGKWVNPQWSQHEPLQQQTFDSLTKYLGGWVNWSGTFDLSFVPVGYVLGNATKWAEYKLQGDMCDFRFEYLIGGTTVFPNAANAFLRIILPFPAADTGVGGIYNLGAATATDTSAGQTTTGQAYRQNGFANLAQFLSRATASANTFETQWIQNGAGSWPFVPVPGGAQAPWAAGDSIVGALHYRISPQARQ